MVGFVFYLIVEFIVHQHTAVAECIVASGQVESY